MKKVLVSILIVCLYSFPYVYFSMYQDFTNRLMVGYLVMIVATSLLAFFGKFLSNIIVLIIGNILSFLVSLYFINEMVGTESWESYFKPLSSFQLLFFVSILNIIPQSIAIFFSRKYKNKVKIK